MIRSIIVGALVAAGFVSCFWGPFPALLFYLWYAYFRPDAWLWVDWPTALGLSTIIGGTAVLLALVFPVRLRFSWNLGLPLLALFAIQSYVSTRNSLAPDWSWQWWFDFARVLVIGFLIALEANTPRRYRLVLLVIALSLGAEAAKQGWVGLVLRPGGRNLNPHPVLGDNNGVALGMFMLAPFFKALADTASSHAERWFHRLMLVGTIWRGIVTYSRGGFLAAGALALVLVLRSKRRLRVALACVAICALVAVVMPPEYWSRMRTVTASAEARDDSATSRIYFWRLAWDMASRHPWTGIGFNAFTRVYDSYDETEGKYGSGRAVHSSWFGVLSENGFPGLALFVLLLLVAFANCWRARGRARRCAADEGVGAYATALESSLIVFVVGGSFINGQYSEMLWHFICLSIALATVAADVCARQRQQGIGDGTALLGG